MFLIVNTLQLPFLNALPGFPVCLCPATTPALLLYAFWSGYVRRTTARFAPELGDSLGTYTLARPVADSKSRTDKGKRRNSK